MPKDLVKRQEAGLRHIVRLDSDRNCGWQVRIPFWHPRGPSSQYFSDSRLGGPDLALAAAKAARDRLFGEQLSRRSPQTHRSNTRNTSGAVGLTFSVEIRAGRRQPLFCAWVAYWSPPGQGQCKTTFSVGKNRDFWTAWDCALRARQERTGVSLSTWELAKARLHAMLVYRAYLEQDWSGVRSLHAKAAEELLKSELSASS